VVDYLQGTDWQFSNGDPKVKREAEEKRAGELEWRPIRAHLATFAPRPKAVNADREAIIFAFGEEDAIAKGLIEPE
jgi:hypothetical protein